MADHDMRTTVEMVRAAVATLPDKHRPVVVLRMIEGYSTRETAQILGIPEGTVLSRLARAMDQLRRHLAPQVQNEMEGTHDAA
jgi:RNA polymerase sigma-70 factor (ECF subfamily)